MQKRHQLQREGLPNRVSKRSKQELLGHINSCSLPGHVGRAGSLQDLRVLPEYWQSATLSTTESHSVASKREREATTLTEKPQF